MTEIPAAAEVLAAAVVPAAEVLVEDTGDEPQYQELCWNCDKQLTIRVHTYCIKCISTGEEHTVCGDCWYDVFEDDDDWVDENASSDEDSDAE